jgi:hypothetical protein
MKQRDPTDLAGQERDREAKALKSKVERDQETADFKWLMSDKRGRRFMWRLLSMTGLYRSSFTGNSNNTFFNEGARNIGLMLISEVNELTPDAYAMMLDEQRKK